MLCDINVRVNTLWLIGLDIYKRQSDEGNCFNIVMKLPYDSVVSACNGDRGFVALHLADAVKLGNLIAFLHIPSYKDSTEKLADKKAG